MPRSAIGVILREVVRRNRVLEGIVYAQVTRGVAARDHAFPERSLPSSLVVTAKELAAAPRHRRAELGVAVITVPDNRWERVDIKTIALLPNVLAKQAAHEAGAFEAWLVDREGFVTEGSSTNAWIVNAEGILVTRQTGRGILKGITRSVVCDIVGSEALRLEERPFSLAEALAAREAFLTSASTAVTPIITINGAPVGEGKPGPVARHLRAIFDQAIEIAPFWSSGERR
jgi:D-alanine transaminase